MTILKVKAILILKVKATQDIKIAFTLRIKTILKALNFFFTKNNFCYIIILVFCKEVMLWLISVMKSLMK